MQWIADNIGSILVCLAVFGLLALLVASLVKQKKQGKTTCGCGCEHCAMRCACHANSAQTATESQPPDDKNGATE